MSAAGAADAASVDRAFSDAASVPTSSTALTELQGSYQVATVDASNHAHIITVKTGALVGSQVVVVSGLHLGDRVVADGVQKIRTDALVNPIPFAADAGAK